MLSAHLQVLHCPLSFLSDCGPRAFHPPERGSDGLSLRESLSVTFLKAAGLFTIIVSGFLTFRLWGSNQNKPFGDDAGHICFRQVSVFMVTPQAVRTLDSRNPCSVHVEGSRPGPGRT